MSININTFPRIKRGRDKQNPRQTPAVGTTEYFLLEDYLAMGKVGGKTVT
jgi:hypothetical protein